MMTKSDVEKLIADEEGETDILIGGTYGIASKH